MVKKNSVNKVKTGKSKTLDDIESETEKIDDVDDANDVDNVEDDDDADNINSDNDADTDNEYDGMNEVVDDVDVDDQLEHDNDVDDDLDDIDAEKKNSESEGSDNDEDCLYKFSKKKRNDSDDDDIDNIDDDEGMNDDSDNESEDFFFQEETNEAHENIFVPDDKRITKPVLTKYERIRLLGERAKQLSLGAKPMIKGLTQTDPKKTARLELEMKVIPLFVVRPLPTGQKERWRIKELSISN